MGIREVRKFRRIHIGVSIILGFMSPLICYLLIPNFNILNQPLSYFGIVEETSNIWFYSLLMIFLGVVLNGERRVDENIIKIHQNPLKIILTISSMSLFGLTFFTMEQPLIHNIFATIFFLGYSLFVFLYGLSKSLKTVRGGRPSLIIGILMLSSPLLIIPFPSYGVMEITHISLTLIWNGTMLFKSRLIT